MAKQKQELLMGGVNMIPRNRTIPMQPILLGGVIPESEMQKTTEDIDAENFLGSLVGQGFAMLGAGVAGRDPGKVADQFSDMRLYSDRQKESQRQREEAIKQSQELMNPNSEISKRQRTLYSRFLGEIPSDVSASDLKDPVVLRGLQEQQMKLQAPKGGGVRQPAQSKPEKEVKSTQKYVDEYREHVGALSEMSNVLDKIKKLGRTRFGTFTPDVSTDTQAYASTLDRAAQPLIKTLAGPGTLQKEERDTYGKLVPNANTRADLALRQATDIIIEGTGKALSKMNSDLSSGDLSKKDYDSFINQYNEQLTKKEMGLNQVINPNNGRLEERQKIERTLKDGSKVITDQFGYVWE